MIKVNSNYNVIEVKDFKTAEYYGRYSCSNSPLWYSQSRNAWNRYTNNGQIRVYLILNKNWKNIPEEHGKNTPYDEYGLSMIFLFIDEYGEIVYSNTRWNHETDGQGPSNVDQSFTKNMISQLLGVNFDSVFKPLSNQISNNQQNESKQIIRITENDLHNIIKKTVKRILKEADYSILNTNNVSKSNLRNAKIFNKIR